MWTDVEMIRQQLLKKWNQGVFLSNFLRNEEIYPYSIKLKIPKVDDLSTRYTEVLSWIQSLRKESNENVKHSYQLIEKEFQFKNFGKNSLPVAISFSNRQDLLKWIRKKKEFDLFEHNINILLNAYPELKIWAEKYPFKILQLTEEEVKQLILTIKWFQNNPKSNKYLREINIPFVDTKFIENHKSILWDLLESILSEEEINGEGIGFEEKFYLRKKPIFVNLRVFEKRYFEGFTTLSLPIEELSEWEIPFEYVFVVENEINFYSFPYVENACVIFGKGYAVEELKKIKCLAKKKIFYWGDIDTHGFKILGILRSYFPNTFSFFMNEETFVKYSKFWVVEKKPFLDSVMYLTPREEEMLHALQNNKYGLSLRLEQERIPYQAVVKEITAILQEEKAGERS